MSSLQLWTYCLLSTFTVSIIPILFLLIVPFLHRNQPKSGNLKVSGRWLNWFLCFAAGALLGDAFLHLINGHGHDGHGHVHNGGNEIAVLLGIAVFFGIEMFSISSCNHVHSHAHVHPKKTDDHDHQADPNTNGVNGFLSLVADSIHNFTDGLTIAAAYASSTTAGISTTIAIFVHEIPHEMGDYAVLSRAGYTHHQVLKCQLLTATTAFLGTFLGLALQSSKNSTLLAAFKSIMPFSAGGFIYLALASIVPEIMREKRCKREAFMQFTVFTMGILLMAVLE